MEGPWFGRMPVTGRYIHVTMTHGYARYGMINTADSVTSQQNMADKGSAQG